MKHQKLISLCSMCAVLLVAPVSHARDEFFGTIENRPKDNVGAWTIGGRTLNVTAKTELDEDHGPFVVGACVEVEHNGNIALEISTEEKKHCSK